MKKITIFLSAFMLLAGFLSAQNCALTVKQISTNPSNPKDADFNVPSTNVNPFRNTFDWGKWYANAGTNSGTFNSIELNPDAGWVNRTNFSLNNPYSGVNSDYFYLNRGGTAHPNQLDFQWQDGWELMFLGTGKFPDGEDYDKIGNRTILNQPHALPNSTVPYFVLYNKYTRTLRIFANLNTSVIGTVNHVQIILKHSTAPDAKVSGILRHTSQYDQALDLQTKYFLVSSQNAYPNNAVDWFSADFKLGYDPCVCNFLSNLDFEFYAINTSTVSLIGRSVSLNLPLSQNGIPVYDSFLSYGDMFKTQNDRTVGLIYKSMSGLFNNYTISQNIYKNQLEVYESDEAKAARTLMPIIKTAVIAGATAGLAAAGVDPALAKALASTKLVNDKQSKDISTKALNFAKTTLGKTYDKLGLQFFSNSLIAPEKPTMPEATFTESMMSGEIVQGSTVKIASFFTPGSYMTTTPATLKAYNYPIYNVPTGTYALLESPVFYKKESRDVLVRFEDRKVNGLFSLLVTLDKKKRFDYMIKLKDPLKYVLNKSVPINKSQSNLYGLIQIELTSKDLTKMANAAGPASIFEAGNFKLLTSIKGKSNLSGPNDADTFIYTSDWQNVKDLGETEFWLQFQHSFFFYNETSNSHACLPALFNEQEANINLYSVDYSKTQEEKLSTWESYIWSRSGHNCAFLDNQNFDIDITRVKFKVMTDLYYNQNSSNNQQINTTDVYTYLLFDKKPLLGVATEIDKLINTNNWDDVAIYSPGTITLFDQHITPTSKYVNKIIGNKLILNAERVRIQGFLTVESGYTYEINAFEDIESAPNSYIYSNVSLNIKRDFFNFGQINETADSYLETYCQSTKYRAKELAPSAFTDDMDTTTKDEDLPDEKVKNNIVENLIMNAYPNPVSNMLKVAFHGLNKESTENINLTIFNISGAMVYNNVYKASSGINFSINVSNLPAGLYIIKGNVGSFNKTVKFNVIHD